MASQSLPSLVSTQWLAEALKTATGTSLRVLDATFVMPGSETCESFEKQHIPSSLHFDLNKCRDTTSPYMYTIPSPEHFADFVGKLGVSNDTHVVVCENDPFYKIMTAPRVWWMFRYFGHTKVSVLNGGLQQWVADGYPVTDQKTPAPGVVAFRAVKQPHLYTNYDQVLKNQTENKFQLMDSRPVEWYDGSMDSLWPGMKLGIINTANNIPFSTLMQEGTGKFKSTEELRTLFQSKGIDLSRPLTSTCMVGVTACILALGAFQAGKEDVAIFDGSWDEYSRKGPENTMTIYPDPKASL